MNLLKKIIFTLLLSLVLSTFHFSPAQANGGPIGNRACDTGVLVGQAGDEIDELPFTYFVTFIAPGTYEILEDQGAGCEGSVIIALGVTSLGFSAFFNNEFITSVDIPNSVTSIGNTAFYLNTSLASVTIGNSVESIGTSAFKKTALTSVDIPDSVTSIGDNAFAFTPLTSVTIGNSVESIGGGAFADTFLASVDIPDSVTSIGEEAFIRTQLTSVTIGNSVESIGGGAFADTLLASVDIPSSVTSIAYAAFGEIPAFTLTSPSETVAINTAAIGFTIANLSAGANTFSISAIPDGMSFDTETGALTGTPSTAASATAYTVTAISLLSASTIFTLTVADGDATAPAAPNLNSVTGGNKQLSITFTSGGDGGAAITDGEYSLNGGAYISAGTTTSPFTITGLSGRTTYSVTIKARNSFGLSTASSSLSATTTDSSLDASEAAAAEAARVAAAAAEAARVAAVNSAADAAKKQKELTELLSVIPSIAGLALNLGDLTNTLLLKQKCVKGTKTKYVKKGAKCPKGYVRKK